MLERWLWGALLISSNVVGVHQACDRDCFLHLVPVRAELGRERWEMYSAGVVLGRLGHTKGFWG